MIAARQIFLGRGGGARLPYDAEVEYLESTGTQYINTGVVATNSHGFSIDIATAQTEGATNTRIFGAHEGNTRCGFALYGLAESQDFFFGWNEATGYTANLPQRFVVSLNYKNDRSAIFNGTTYLSQLGTLGNMTQPIYLLNADYNNAPFSGQFTIGRLYGAKITIGSDVAHEYIPVRFTNELGQSEGAMYDRVSGQLFRNQGTGAFLYGGDVYSVPVETSQYVQNGLVAMWDGKENAGVGKHSTAVGAVNLAGSAELVFPSNLAKWSMGEKSFDLSLIYHSDTRGQITIPANTFSLAQFSTEICLSRGSDSTGEFGLVQDGVSYLTELSGASTALFRAYNSGGGIVINAQPNIGDTTAPRTLTFTYDGTTARFYADGELKTSAAMELRAAFNAGLVRIGSGYLYNSGSIFDIRIYNKALTAEQVSANAAIDQSRFNA